MNSYESHCFQPFPRSECRSFIKPTDVPMFLQDEVNCVGAALTARSRRNKELIFLPWDATRYCVISRQISQCKNCTDSESSWMRLLSNSSLLVRQQCLDGSGPEACVSGPRLHGQH